ncbi:dihydrolipoyl dehydrogenase [Clostridia bacterium]|nr:dihydrolipoyl dehydrogenase [Clostridia bacterium]
MTYDVAVLGAGPGGYEAAIRCAQYGLKTALIEERELGGTCLNRGCIPTKAMLECGHAYERAEHATVFGVTVQNVGYDFAKMAARRDAVVSKLRAGIAGLEKAHGVTVISGRGVLSGADSMLVGGETVRADKIILATGGAPARPPIPGADGANVLTSDEVLAMNDVPESVVIIGGGVIGIEFATLFSMLGKPVTVLEMLPEILAGVDAELVVALKRSLKKRKIEFVTGAKVTGIAADGIVSYELSGETKNVKADCCILSAGRRPQTAGLGLESIGVKVERGFISTDECMRTNIPNIYAVGDITGKIQLAHVASAQGLVAAAHCAGRPCNMRYDIVPACVYTEPELAWVGLTEEQAKTAGRAVITGRFNAAGNGRAMTMGEDTGLVKVIADAVTGELLGAHILAPRATDMVAEVAAVMRSEGTIDELAATIHPHPTISEMIMEAAHDAEGLCCHLPPKRGAAV